MYIYNQAIFLMAYKRRADASGKIIDNNRGLYFLSAAGSLFPAANVAAAGPAISPNPVRPAAQVATRVLPGSDPALLAPRTSWRLRRLPPRGGPNGPGRRPSPLPLAQP